MARDDDRIDAAVTKLRRVRDEQLDSLAGTPAAKALLEEVVAMPESQPREGKRREGARRGFMRRPLVLRGAIALGAVAALIVVLSVVNVFGDKGPAAVDEAAALGHASAALTLTPGAILHVDMLGSQTNRDGSVVRWSDESWQLNAAPYTRRQLEKTPDAPIAETVVDANGLSRVFDAAADTIYQKQGQAGLAASSGAADEFRQAALDLLHSGKAKVEGHETVDGRDALRIVAAKGHEVYLVDATTYDPIEWRTTGDGGGTSLVFTTYEVIPASAANLELVDLAKQHVGAKLDTDAAHYDQAISRLFPKG